MRGTTSRNAAGRTAWRRGGRGGLLARTRRLGGLLAALALVACDGGRGSPSRLERPAEPAARTLSARWVGAADGEAPLVVLLHGYGAPGDDLVPLARALREALDGRVRFALLEAPLPRPPSGRAWWPIEDFARDRPADRGDEAPTGLREARRDVLAWLEARRAEGHLRPDRTVLGGFSQGAMLAADAALEWAARPAGLAVMSGGPVEEGRWVRRLRERAPPFVLVSHGRRDPLLAFEAAARLRDRFARAGSAVTFVPFDGGHTIPPAVVAALADLLERALLPQ
jgi:phospholipase/carboxylesterase